MSSHLRAANSMPSFHLSADNFKSITGISVRATLVYSQFEQLFGAHRQEPGGRRDQSPLPSESARICPRSLEFGPSWQSHIRTYVGHYSRACQVEGWTGDRGAKRTLLTSDRGGPAVWLVIVPPPPPAQTREHRHAGASLVYQGRSHSCVQLPLLRPPRSAAGPT